MTNSGAYPADFQAPESLDGWGTQHYINVLGARVQNDVIRAVEMLPGGLLPVGSSLIVPVKHDRIRRLLVAPTMEHPEAVEPRNASRAMAAILRRCKAEGIGTCQQL